jgi:hypothetical protein
MSDSRIVAFDAADRTVTVQFDQPIKPKSFAIGQNMQVVPAETAASICSQQRDLLRVVLAVMEPMKEYLELKAKIAEIVQ